MFEQYKLNKYQKYIKAFAYDAVRLENDYYIQSYIVLKKNNDYKYVKFTKMKVYRSDYEVTIKTLKANGYRPLAEFIKENQLNKETNSKILTKSKFKIIK